MCDMIRWMLLGCDPYSDATCNGAQTTSLLKPFWNFCQELDEVEDIIRNYEHSSSVYMSTLCRAVRKEIIDPLHDLLSQHAYQSLHDRSQAAVIPISQLHVLLSDHDSIMNATVTVLQKIVNNHIHIRGVRVMDVVMEYSQSGIRCVAHIFSKILQEYLDAIILHQVISWIVYGIISDPYEEFWIVPNKLVADSWNFSYQINIALLPETYLSFETCRSIYFIGKALHISRSDRSITSPCLHQGYLDRLLPHVRRHSGLREDFESTIRDLHQQAAKSLWRYIVEEQDLLLHLNNMKSFFLLANGAFYEEFIAQCGDQILNRPNRTSNINSARSAFQYAARLFQLDDSESFQRFRLYSRCKHFTVDFRRDTTSFNLCGCSRISEDHCGIILSSPQRIARAGERNCGLIWSRTQCCISYGFHVAFTVELTGTGTISFILQNNSPYALPAALLSSLWIEFHSGSDHGYDVSLRYNSDIIESWSDQENIFDSRQHHISIKWIPYDLNHDKASLQIAVDESFKCSVAADRISRRMRLLGHRCFIGLYGVSDQGDGNEGLFQTPAISWRELQEPSSISQIDLSLDFQIPKGIDLLLGVQEIDRYSDIFNFLLRIKFVQWYLRRAWTSTDDQNACCHEIRLLRSRMQFLLDNLQIYLQVDVIETHFTNMLSSIRDTQDFDTIRLAHDRYLAVLAQHFFLRSQVIMKALTHVLDICLQFCKALDNCQEGRIQSQINSFAELFDRESCFLFSIISSKARHQSSPHLEQLILRIDYNGFLSSAVSEAGLT